MALAGPQFRRQLSRSYQTHRRRRRQHQRHHRTTMAAAYMEIDEDGYLYSPTAPDDNDAFEAPSAEALQLVQFDTVPAAAAAASSTPPAADTSSTPAAAAAAPAPAEDDHADTLEARIVGDMRGLSVVCCVCSLTRPKVAVQPVAMPCEHTICMECFRKMTFLTPYGKPHGRECPICRAVNANREGDIDHKMAKVIRETRVMCHFGACASEPHPVLDDDAHHAACGARPVACDQCKKSVLKSALAHHRTDECAERRSPCRVCGEMLRPSDTEAHGARDADGDQPATCVGMIPCSRACTPFHRHEAAIRADKKQHKRAAKRKKRDDGTAVASGTLLERLEEEHGVDNFYAVTVVRRAEHEAHVTRDCPRRMVKCIACGDEYEARSESHHLRQNIERHQALLLARVFGASTGSGGADGDIPRGFRLVGTALATISADALERGSYFDFQHDGISTSEYKLDVLSNRTKSKGQVVVTMRRQAQPRTRHAAPPPTRHWMLRATAVCPVSDPVQFHSEFDVKKVAPGTMRHVATFTTGGGGDTKSTTACTMPFSSIKAFERVPSVTPAGWNIRTTTGMRAIFVDLLEQI
jgi:hypothetical protein